MRYVLIIVLLCFLVRNVFFVTRARVLMSGRIRAAIHGAHCLLVEGSRHAFIGDLLVCRVATVCRTVNISGIQEFGRLTLQ